MIEEKRPEIPDSPESDLPERFIVKMPTAKPIATYAILGLTIAVFLLQLLSEQGLLFFGNCPYFFSPDVAACYGLKINEFIVQGQYWRLLAPILLHGSLLHIGFNMYALNILGPELERHFGHWPFLALYLASGFAGFVMSFLLTSAPSLGASTAIFGLLAAQGVFIYRNQHIFGSRGRIALRSILNIAVINFAIGLSPGIDNWGHFGGLLGGLLFSWLATPVYQIGGDGPEFDLINQRDIGSALQAFVLTALVFAALAITAIV
jgi:rhomboid protease GluP